MPELYLAVAAADTIAVEVPGGTVLPAVQPD
jgi:hypothetical protein